MSCNCNSLIKVTCNLLIDTYICFILFLFSIGFHFNFLNLTYIGSFCSVYLVSFHLIILSCFTVCSFHHCFRQHIVIIWRDLLTTLTVHLNLPQLYIPVAGILI